MFLWYWIFVKWTECGTRVTHYEDVGNIYFLSTYSRSECLDNIICSCTTSLPFLNSAQWHSYFLAELEYHVEWYDDIEWEYVVGQSGCIMVGLNRVQRYQVPRNELYKSALLRNDVLLGALSISLGDPSISFIRLKGIWGGGSFWPSFQFNWYTKFWPSWKKNVGPSCRSIPLACGQKLKKEDY